MSTTMRFRKYDVKGKAKKTVVVKEVFREISTRRQDKFWEALP